MNRKNLNQLKIIIYAVTLFIALASLFVFTSCKSDYQRTITETAARSDNPEGKQVIEVIASSGGYSPKNIEAEAGVPTILIMKSDGAYGCERAFNIPDLNIAQILPENGNTEFDLGTQEKGTKLLGVCSMGMYYFQIFFN